MYKIIVIVSFLCITVGNAQIVNIPDTNFKNALLNHNPIIDINGDDEIQTSEAGNFFGSLNVSNKNISDLTGIEEFTNIYNLDCGFNQISNLDLNQNLFLEEINCSNNLLTTFNFNRDIEQFFSFNLNCSNNLLTNLDVSNLSGDEEFSDININCSNNNLTSINLLNSLFTSLDCSMNNLQSLDFNNSFFQEFSFVDCSFNNLTTLDLNNINLGEIRCRNNNLTTVNIENSNISNFLCQNNNLNTLSVENSYIHFLVCANNELTNLSFNENNSIILLNCRNNLSLETVEVNNLSDLFWVDVSDCTSLTYANLKNGNNVNMVADSFFDNVPNLETVCVDDINSGFSNELITTVDQEIVLTDDCTVLATNQNTLIDFSVYPIPTINVLNIQSKTNIIHIEIYNKLGQRVFATQYNNDIAQTINISNLKTDIYFLKLIDENGNIGIKKIIKQQ